MVSLGVEAKKLTVISYGKEKLLDTTDTETAYTKNRRANFAITSK
jgi:peptidoglycan-associated lipoprotein